MLTTEQKDGKLEITEQMGIDPSMVIAGLVVMVVVYFNFGLIPMIDVVSICALLLYFIARERRIVTFDASKRAFMIKTVTRFRTDRQAYGYDELDGLFEAIDESVDPTETEIAICVTLKSGERLTIVESNPKDSVAWRLETVEFLNEFVHGVRIPASIKRPLQ